MVLEVIIWVFGGAPVRYMFGVDYDDWRISST
jgi:hypothetical protein